jgi:hypothetical protein
MLDEIQEQLNSAATQVQAHIAQNDGTVYSVEDLQRALSAWLELSIEALVEDAMFHVVEGDRAQAFNRRAWELQLARLKPVEVEEVREAIAA